MTVPDMVSRWQAAWQSLDPARIETLYSPDATHMSAVVAERMKRPNGTLRGKAEIRAYAETTAGRLKSFRAEILEIISDETEGGGRAAVEYWRVVDGDEEHRTRVVEIVEWQDGLITACRVFHF